MKWYGSLQNRILERTIPAKPEIGMGVTEIYYSDRRAYEVVEIIDDRHIKVRRMLAKCNDWFAGDWEVSSDPDGMVLLLFLTKKGVWRQRIGRALDSNIFFVGKAEEYVDPSF